MRPDALETSSQDDPVDYKSFAHWNQANPDLSAGGENETIAPNLELESARHEVHGRKRTRPWALLGPALVADMAPTLASELNVDTRARYSLGISRLSHARSWGCEICALYGNFTAMPAQIAIGWVPL